MAIDYGEKIMVVGVTMDGEASTYGLSDPHTGVRELVTRRQFSNYGQARQFAIEFESAQRNVKRKKT